MVAVSSPCLTPVRLHTGHCTLGQLHQDKLAHIIGLEFDYASCKPSPEATRADAQRSMRKMDRWNNEDNIGGNWRHSDCMPDEYKTVNEEEEEETRSLG